MEIWFHRRLLSLILINTCAVLSDRSFNVFLFVDRLFKRSGPSVVSCMSWYIYLFKRSIVYLLRSNIYIYIYVYIFIQTVYRLSVASWYIYLFKPCVFLCNGSFKRSFCCCSSCLNVVLLISLSVGGNDDDAPAFTYIFAVEWRQSTPTSL